MAVAEPPHRAGVSNCLGVGGVSQRAVAAASIRPAPAVSLARRGRKPIRIEQLAVLSAFSASWSSTTNSASDHGGSHVRFQSSKSGFAWSIGNAKPFTNTQAA